MHRNPLIGYVQGFSFILARLIQIIPEPPECFWTLTMLLEKILPIDYYSHLLGVRADSQLFAEVLLP